MGSEESGPRRDRRHGGACLRRTMFSTRNARPQPAAPPPRSLPAWRQLPERVRYALWEEWTEGRTTRQDVAWMRDDVLFHGTRHPLSNRLLLLEDAFYRTQRRMAVTRSASERAQLAHSLPLRAPVVEP